MSGRGRIGARARNHPRRALLYRWCLALLCCLLSARANATPAVAVHPVDADLAVGGSFVAEITIAEVQAWAPLSAFEFDLDFDPSLLRPKSVSAAGFLPGSAVPLEAKLLGTRVEFAAVGIGGVGRGAGVLARVRFDVLAPGTGTLDLNHVKLSSLGGISLHPGTPGLPDGRVTDGHYVVAVPEPAIPLLSAAALLALSLLVRRESGRKLGVEVRGGARVRRGRYGTAGTRVCLMSQPQRAPRTRMHKFVVACAMLALALPAGPAVAASLPDPDPNDDGVVDVFDAAIVSSCRGQPAASCDPRADLDGDGIVAASDLDRIVAHFGESGFSVAPPGSLAPVVRITLPADGASSAASPIAVRGLVDLPFTQVDVDVGGSAVTPVTSDAAGAFVVPNVALVEGGNTIAAVASDGAGHTGSARVHVWLDTEPPQLRVNLPPGRWTVAGPLLALDGTLSDVGAAASGSGPVRVVVRGPLYAMSAEVQDGAFSLRDFVLAPGQNSLEIEATDAAGNSFVQKIGVLQISPAPQPEGTPSLRVLTYNTAFLSADIHLAPSLALPTGFDWTLEPNIDVFGELSYEERAAKIAEGILRGDQDVVVLNEVFSDAARAVFVNLLAGSGVYPNYVAKLAAQPIGQVDSLATLLTALALDHPYVSESLLPDIPGLLDASVDPADSGLMIFSRYPFLPLVGAPNDAICSDDGCEFWGWNDGAPLAPSAVGFRVYTQCADMDCYASKGAGLVEIDTPDRPAHVVFTHIQADSAGTSHAAIRKTQYQQVKQLLTDSVSSSELVAWPLYMAGDFNTIGENKTLNAPFSEWHDIFHPATEGDNFFACGNAGPCSFVFGNGDLLTDPWGFETSPDDLGHSQIDDDARLDYILHNGADDTLCMQQIAIAWDVAENGSRWYSDHKPVRADYNDWAPRCTPNRDASPVHRPQEISFPSWGCDDDPTTSAPDCQQDLALPGEIGFPGSFQWFVITQPGSYSIKVTPSTPGEKVAYDVYAKNDLSRPIAPFENKDDPRWGTPYLMLEPPYWVRVYAVDSSTPLPKPDRTAQDRNYSIHFHQHLCRSPKDACFLPPEDLEHPAWWPQVTQISVEHEMWFQFKTGGVREGHLDPEADGWPQIEFREEADLATDLDCLDSPVIEKYDQSDPPVLLYEYPVGPREIDPDDHSWDGDPYADERYAAPHLDTDTADTLQKYYLKLRRPGGFVCDGALHTRIAYATTLSYFRATKLRNYSDAAEELVFRTFFDHPLTALPSDDALIAICPSDPLCRIHDGEVMYLAGESALQGYFVTNVVPMVIGDDPLPPFVLKLWGMGEAFSHPFLGLRERSMQQEGQFIYADGPNGDEASYYAVYYFVLCHQKDDCKAW